MKNRKGKLSQMKVAAIVLISLVSSTANASATTEQPAQPDSLTTVFSQGKLSKLCNKQFIWRQK